MRNPKRRIITGRLKGRESDRKRAGNELRVIITDREMQVVTDLQKGTKPTRKSREKRGGLFTTKTLISTQKIMT